MAGRFDDLLADIPQTQQTKQNVNRFDDLTSDLGTPKRNLSFKDNVNLVRKIASVVPEIVPSPTDRIRKGLDVAGEKVAEELGRRGHPTVGALYGTEIQMLPDILGAATSIGALETSQEPLAQAIRNTPRMLSPRYDALNEAAGISKDLPVRLGNIPKYRDAIGNVGKTQPLSPQVAPSSYPKDTNSLLNFARARIEGLGERLSPQELNDYKSMINTAIRERKIIPGTDQFAVASKLIKEKVTPLLNRKVSGKADLDKIYALSKKLRVAPEVAKKVWDYVGPKLRWGVIGVP